MLLCWRIHPLPLVVEAAWLRYRMTQFRAFQRRPSAYSSALGSHKPLQSWTPTSLGRCELKFVSNQNRMALNYGCPPGQQTCNSVVSHPADPPSPVRADPKLLAQRIIDYRMDFSTSLANDCFHMLISSPSYPQCC